VQPRRVVLARRRGNPAQQITRPQQLRLRRLVQRARLLLPDQRIWSRTPAEAGQRSEMALYAAPPGRSQPQARRGRDPHGETAGTLAARNPRELTTVPPGHRTTRAAEGALPGRGPHTNPGRVR